MPEQAQNLMQFQNKFGSERVCQRHLFKMRWPDGFKCPRCGLSGAYFHSKRQLYQCKSCGYQTSLTAGTVFHGTKIPLAKWFRLIWLIKQQQNCIPIRSLQRILDIRNYKTLLTMTQKIRKALADQDHYHKLAHLIDMRCCRHQQAMRSITIEKSRYSVCESSKGEDCMTRQEERVRAKMRLIELAQKFKNISKACRVMGVSRQHFYDIKKAYDYGGIAALQRKSSYRHNLKNRVAPEIESAVVRTAEENPAFGALRVANELRKDGVIVSPGGVRSIWLRHGLETAKKRRIRFEERASAAEIVHTEIQLITLDQIKREKAIAPKGI